MAALAFDSARQRDTLREQARTDGLTGLLNHRACHERLQRGDRRARRGWTARSASSSLDLDHFKTVNDAYGHAEGDKVLIAAAEQAALRRARGRRRRAARRRGVRADPAGRRRRAAPPRRPSAPARRSPRSTSAGRPLSCSAGVASFPDDAREAGRLLELADGALYWAKRSGRDQSRRYDRRLAGQLSGDGQRAEVEALLAARGLDRAGVPARAGARHRARRRLRGAGADARRARSGRPTSGSTRPIAPGSGRRSRPPRCAPRCGRTAGRSGRSSRSTSARARCSSPEVRAALPDGPRRAS